MIKLNTEYFNSPYYFYLKDKGDKIAIYYSVSNTITESRDNDEVIVVDKDVFEDIQKVISNIMKSGKKLSKEYVHKLLDKKSKSFIKQLISFGIDRRLFKFSFRSSGVGLLNIILVIALIFIFFIILSSLLLVFLI
jgi:hypothetical protein